MGRGMQIRGAGELLEEVQDRGLCVDCGGCVGLCPYFQSHKGRISMLFDCSIEVGRCHAHCPKTEVDMDAVSQRVVGGGYTGEPVGKVIRIVKARAGRKMAGRAAYQNGGTVSSLLAFALDSGRIDAAALTDRRGLTPVPRVVTDAAGVLSCAASKYMASPSVSAVYTAMAENYSRIAFVGTPCQATSVGQMRCNPLGENGNDSIALTVGLFCTWALDMRLFAELIPDGVDPQDITGMDIPPPPASFFALYTREGEVRLPLHRVRGAIPEGCRICPDMTAEFTDLSVGALEGVPGWNCAISRTEAGDLLLTEAVSQGYLEASTLDPMQVDGLFGAAGGKKRRAIDRARAAGLLNNREGPSAFWMSDSALGVIDAWA